MPPEVWFKVRWPDETADVCYSPSTVIKDVFVAGHAYTLTDFVARSEEGLRQASARVKHVRGYACPKACDQLMRIKETAAAFEHLTVPMVIVESFEA